VKLNENDIALKLNSIEMPKVCQKVPAWNGFTSRKEFAKVRNYKSQMAVRDTEI